MKTLFIIGFLLLFLGSFVLVFLDFIFYFLSIKKGREIYFQKKNNKTYLTNSQIQTIQSVFKSYDTLSVNKQREVQKRIIHFLQTFPIHTVGDLVLSPEDQLLLAVCYTQLNLGYKPYNNKSLQQIVIYPEAFYFSAEKQFHKGHYNAQLKTIALSWKDFLSDIHQPNTRHNVALHEFAHACMFEMLQPKNKTNSAALFHYYYLKTIKWHQDVDLKQMLIDSGFVRSYAFTNSFEFIAVLIELYFKQGDEFQRLFPDLYLLTKKMLGQHQLH